MNTKPNGHRPSMPETPQPSESAGKCFDTALRLLARRDHGRQELFRKLKQRGFSDGDIHRAFTRCDQYQYLDDMRFANTLTRHLQRRGYGTRRIRQSLREKGIQGDDIDHAIENHCTEHRQLEQCHAMLVKKLKPGNDPRRMKQKLYRYLLGRGFEPAVVSSALDRALASQRP